MFTVVNRENDLALAHRVQECLRQTYRPSMERLQVETHGGVVTLSGRVFSFHEKQLCLSLCQRVPGVVRVVDRLAVLEPEAPAKQVPR